MKGLKIASRYARSLIELSQEKGTLDRVQADMQLINASCSGSRELMVFLNSPIIRTDKKQAVVRELFGSRVSEITARFLDIIIAKRREMFIPDIAAAFIRQFKQIRHIHTAEIITAAPLDDTLRKQVMDILRGYTHTEIELHEKVSTDLIGGYILTVEDKQDDTSIRTKINKLRRAFRENLYIKDY
jgi:F-type H+-transporting ATPase subunit delta